MPELINRSVRQSVLLDPETKEKLREIAFRNNLSENEIINRALATYLKRFK